MQEAGRENRRLLAIVTKEQLRRVLRYMLSEMNFYRLRHSRSVAYYKIIRCF